MITIIAQKKVIELIHNHADQHQNEIVLSFDQSQLSSFSLILLPISFHVNFEALVPRVRGEGKILVGLEEVHNLQCMIEKPTRVTDKRNQ